MKALSIREPWAHLVIHGLKTVEIRKWSTSYRGRILIHAAQRVDEAATDRFDLRGLPAKAIVGSAVLSDVVEFTPESWYRLADEHLDAGPYQPGLYAWQLVDPRPLAEPIPWPGRLGLFDVASSVLDRAVKPETVTETAQGLLFSHHENG